MSHMHVRVQSYNILLWDSDISGYDIDQTDMGMDWILGYSQGFQVKTDKRWSFDEERINLSFLDDVMKILLETGVLITLGAGM